MESSALVDVLKAVRVVLSTVGLSVISEANLEYCTMAFVCMFAMCLPICTVLFPEPPNVQY